jgi:oligoribonuclease NrnB/cAMP/cGMP phosphodiesterase (DHH superfamily)
MESQSAVLFGFLRVVGNDSECATALLYTYKKSKTIHTDVAVDPGS